MSTTTIPTVTLSNGVEMPQMSLGMAFWNVEKGKIEHNKNFVGFLPEQTYKSLDMALEAGIRGIDTALVYRSHLQIRSVLASWFQSGKLASRDELFVTTKVFHFHTDFATTGTHMPEPSIHETMTPEEVSKMVEQQVERCFEELGLGYLDLVLLHWPAPSGTSQHEGNAARRFAAWQVLEKYYNKGWIRAIGVSNWSEHHLEELKKDGATVTPMVNQIEGSVYLQWNDIVKYCKENNIQVEAFSPLGHGSASVVSDEVVTKIASTHNKDAGQIAMRYLVQKGYALTFASSSAKRMKSNQNIFDFTLSEEEMQLLDGLNGTAESTGQPSPYDMR